jgi:hypothetical protein|tara:strand:+ start:637 stop:999 length:363 start_codon:yes stop_codon:yes gene_type:complete
MSKNFQRVKRDILSEMANSGSHTGESWAQIMLKNVCYLETDQDQQAFWNWIMNPQDVRDVPELTFKPYNPDSVLVEQFSKLSISSEDDEKSEEITLNNTIHKNGLTTYVLTTPALYTLKE